MPLAASGSVTSAAPPVLASRISKNPFTGMVLGILGDDEKNDHRKHCSRNPNLYEKIYDHLSLHGCTLNEELLAAREQIRIPLPNDDCPASGMQNRSGYVAQTPASVVSILRFAIAVAIFGAFPNQRKTRRFGSNRHFRCSPVLYCRPMMVTG